MRRATDHDDHSRHKIKRPRLALFQKEEDTRATNKYLITSFSFHRETAGQGPPRTEARTDKHWEQQFTRTNEEVVKQKNTYRGQI